MQCTSFFSKFLIINILWIIGACTAGKKSVGTKWEKLTFKNIKIAEAKTGEFYGPCEPCIAISPKNPNIMVAGSILDRVHRSTDGGKSWQSETLTSSLGVFGDPVVVADAKGNFLYAHLSDPDKRGWSSENLLDRIVIQQSTDGGKSWSDGSHTGLNHPKDQDKHWLVTHPSTDEVLCSWTEFDKYDSPDTENDKSRILFSKSSDGGTTWSKPLKINQFDGDCLDDDFTVEGAVPAFGWNGEVFCAWAFANKIWFDRSTDGGKSWLETDIEVADQPGGWTHNVPGIGRCNGLPVLVADHSNTTTRGNLYINWADQRAGTDDTDIWLAKSTDGGKNWSKPIRVNDDAPGKHQFFPWITIDPTTGFLYCVFYDRRNYSDLRTDVFVAVSRDGGISFKNYKVSETPFVPTQGIFFGDYNHISAHAGSVRPIWTRMDNGKLSVWTALIEDKK